MKQLQVLFSAVFLFFSYTIIFSQENKHPQPLPKDSIGKTILTPQKVISTDVVTIGGVPVNYIAYTGTIILKDKKDKPTCSMFYVAYFKEGVKDKSQRPLTFFYNGGPGSASLWLHLGSLGPRRVASKDTSMVLPPYQLLNNEYSLLDESDLVFIDAPETGFSQIIDKDNGGEGKPEDFLGIDQDGAAFTDFIVQFLNSYSRWNSPKFLFGESYGTFRTAIVAKNLKENYGVDLNGIILLSQILSYNNMSDVGELNAGLDLPYQLVLPSLTATAWYHKKLPNQPDELEPLLRQVEQFAMGDYALALSKGVLLDKETRDQITTKLHEYTGLPESLIQKANLRITGPVFEKNILADEDKDGGRLDSRFKSYSLDPLSKEPEKDPFTSSISSIYISTANDYIRNTLKFESDRTYKAFGGVITKWDFRHSVSGFPIKLFANVMPDLAQAMTYNPKMKVMLNMGYFDLATPYYQGIYEMHHLHMNPALQKNISYEFYDSGHMVYLHIPSLKKLHDKVAAFIKDAY